MASHLNKKMQPAEQNRPARLEFILNSLREPIYGVDEHGNCNFINQAALDLFGLNRELVLGKKLHSLIPNFKNNGFPDVWEKGKVLNRFGKVRKFKLKEYTFSKRKGKKIWIMDAATPIIKKGEIVGAVISPINITESKKSSQLKIDNDEKVKLSERLYRLVVENSKDLVTLFDISGKVIYASPSYKKILGYNPDEVTNLNSIANNKAIKENFAKALKGKVISNFVVKLKHKKGYTVYLEETSSAIFDQNGNAYLVVSTAHDISERLELERRKDEFITTASHELRTPITTIKSFAQILQKQTNDTKSKYYLEKMNNQIDRLTQLVNDLLDVSKIESGKLILNKEYIQINDLIGDIVEDMQYISIKHKIIFQSKASQIVCVDKFRLSQVLVNLISNAIKFSPKADKVYVTLTKNKSHVKVQVQDFGIGIHKKDLNKIFEPFYQANNKIRQSYSGLGLGLHICAEIIRQHNGTICAKSEKGVGSTFIFTLPL